MVNLTAAARSFFFMSSLLLANFTFAQSDEGSAYSPGDPMQKLRSESRKHQTLVHECLQYCRIGNDARYEIHDITQAFCDSIFQNPVDCRSRVKGTIYVEYTNRFQEKEFRSYVCRWHGPDYLIESTCKAAGKGEYEPAPKQKIFIPELPPYPVQIQ